MTCFHCIVMLPLLFSNEDLHLKQCLPLLQHYQAAQAQLFPSVLNVHRMLLSWSLLSHHLSSLMSIFFLLLLTDVLLIVLELLPLKA